jgi:hypothetical protein
VRGAGAPGDPHRVATLGGDLGLLVGQVQILTWDWVWSSARAPAKWRSS